MADVTPSAAAADWDQWAAQGNVLPPAAPVINDNPAMDSAPSSSLMARLMAAQQGSGMNGPDASGEGMANVPQGAPAAATPRPVLSATQQAIQEADALSGVDNPTGAVVAPGTGGALAAPTPAAPAMAPQASSDASQQPSPQLPSAPSAVPPRPVAPPMAPVGTQPVNTPVQMPPAGAAPVLPSVGQKPSAVPPPGSPEEVGLPAKGAFAPADITAALVKAGIPAADAATLTAVSGAESGYGAHQVGTRNTNGTTDFGIFQVNNGAHPDLNPASLVGAPLDVQAKAAAAVYAKEGLPAWATFNNGAYKGFLGNSGTTAAPSAPSGSSTPDTSYTTNGQFDPAKALAAIKGLQSPLPYPGAGAPSVGNQLLAFAGGMAGTHSPGQALLGGFGAAGKQAQEQTGLQMQANQAVASRNQAQAEMVLQAQAHTQMNQLMAGRLDNQTKTTNFRTDPAAQAAMAAAKTQGSTESAQTVKDNFEQIKEIDDQGAAANQHIPAMQNLLQQIDTSGAGPGVVSGFKRQLATAFGMKIGDTDPTSIQLVNAYNAMDQSQAAQAMKGLGLRTQNEFGTFIKGVGSIDASPAVMKQLVGMQLQGSQAAAQAYSDYHSMSHADQSAMVTAPSGVSGFRAKYIQGAGAAQGVQVGPVGTGTVGAPAAAASAPPGVLQQRVLNGKTYYQHADKSWSEAQ